MRKNEIAEFFAQNFFENLDPNQKKIKISVFASFENKSLNSICEKIKERFTRIKKRAVIDSVRKSIGKIEIKITVSDLPDIAA